MLDVENAVAAIRGNRGELNCVGMAGLERHFQQLEDAIIGEYKGQCELCCSC